MNTSDNNSSKKPTEGQRLGGTLAEGRLPEQGRPERTAVPLTVPSASAQQSTSSMPGPGDGAPVSDNVAQGMEALHFDHKVWLNSLRFYREELFIFQRHLEQFVSTAAVPETMAHVEQFQNRFIRQSEVIDELGHDIKQHDRALSDQFTGADHGVIYRPFGIHNELRDRMETFERLYMELKFEFRNWLASNR